MDIFEKVFIIIFGGLLILFMTWAFWEWVIEKASGSKGEAKKSRDEKEKFFALNKELELQKLSLESQKAAFTRNHDELMQDLTNEIVAYQEKKKQLTQEFSEKFGIQIQNAITEPIKTPLLNLLDFNALYNSLLDGKLSNAFNSDLSLATFDISTSINSGESTYEVSLTHCTCPDFQFRRKPCKHMLFLAYSLGLLQINRELQSSTYNDYLQKVSDYNEVSKKLSQTEKKAETLLLQTKRNCDLKLSEADKKAKILLAQSEAECKRRLDEANKKTTTLITESEAKCTRRLKDAERKIQEAEAYKNYYKGTVESLDSYIKEKCELYPHLAGLVADFLLLHYEKSANLLMTKKHPALTEAKRISELRKETKEYLKELKVLEYKFAYIEELFPNISDIFDAEFDTENYELETDENTDRARYYLSSEEYKGLSVTDRNQLALDRYIAGRKSKWQVGRDYEMYIGYMFSKHDYSVEYTGIIKNFEDMGRDLIAQKGNQVCIVQCKNWSQEKTIHEKHIFQLYGTVVLYSVDHPNTKVEGMFVATTSLSEKAKRIAKHLGITVYDNVELQQFPRIKCNISGRDSERIYHLPFDQQYDKTIVEKEKGEFFAFTVAEAEAQGFRRAMKHFAEA